MTSDGSPCPEQPVQPTPARQPRLPADDSLASGLRGFGPVGVFSMFVILLAGNVTFGNLVALPAGALLVLTWAHLSHTPWRDLGYIRPRGWFRTVACGIVFGISFQILVKSVVMPVLGAAPVNSTYHFL